MWCISSLVPTIQYLCCCGPGGKNDNVVAPMSERTQKADPETGVAAEKGKEIGILDMPKVIIQGICDNLEYHDIMSLRKTCQSFRRFLNTDYDPSLTKLYIDAGANSKALMLNDNHWYSYIHQPRNLNGCELAKGNNQGWFDHWFVKGLDFEEAFLGDFKLAMVNQKKVLEQFAIMFDIDDPYPSAFKDAMYDFLEMTLKSRKTLLKVETLIIEAATQKQILPILQYFDPAHLKKDWPADTIFHVDKLLVLEQLKLFKPSDKITLKIEKEHMANFLKCLPAAVTLTMRNMEPQFFWIIKESCRNSSTFEEYIFDLHDCHILDDARAQFGEPLFFTTADGQSIHCWYYSIPGNQEEVVVMYLADEDYLGFDRFPRENVEEEERILG